MLTRGVTSAVRKSTANLNPIVQDFVKTAEKLLGMRKLSEEDMHMQLLQLNNVWRTGKAVHGRRYPGSAGRKLLAASAFVERRMATWTKGFLSVNSMYSLPATVTGKRRNSSLAQACFSLQPPAAFSAMANWTPQPSHVCCDEVAVNQVVDSIPSTDPPGYEVAGLSNRCLRENNPEGVQYIMRDEGGVLVRRTTIEDGSVVQAETVEDRTVIDTLNSIPPATLLCVWIVFDPVRGKRSFISATVPSCGDLTTLDDATMLHDVIKRAQSHGRSISFYGADNAAPHAALARGIVRRLSAPEGHALFDVLASSIKDLAANECPNWENVAATLVARFQRPISVLQHMLQRLMEADGSKAKRVEEMAADQWTVPYLGLPYAFHICAITGRLLGISPEWRRDNRLMVCTLNACY